MSSSSGLPISRIKVRVPHRRRELITRTRLIDGIYEQLEKRLPLIVAPAGYGKTMLLSAWANESQIPVAWITLEEGENDLVRFFHTWWAPWRKLNRAFLEALPTCYCPQLPPGSDFVSDLVNELNLIQQKFVLVLDDYHLISEQAVHDTVIHLLAHLPPQMHLY